MKWNDSLVIRSLESGNCEMCDNSYDPRGIREHLADVQKIGRPPQVNQLKIEGSHIKVRERTRSRPRRSGK